MTRIDPVDVFVVIASWLATSSLTFIVLAFMEKSFWLMVCGMVCIPGVFAALDIACKIKDERRK